MTGHERRLSDFLGKQYIIYCWASCSFRRDNLPVWQKDFMAIGGGMFTVVGIALDAEGIAPAKRYYQKHRVTFPALVDPNYSTPSPRPISSISTALSSRLRTGGD